MTDGEAETSGTKLTGADRFLFVALCSLYVLTVAFLGGFLARAAWQLALYGWRLG